MGGLNPGARSALEKLMLPMAGVAWGRDMAATGVMGYPVTTAMQSWHVLQLWQPAVPASPVAWTCMGQSAGMAACFSLSKWPVALVSIASTVTLSIAFNCLAAIERAITSTAQPRAGSRAIMRTRSRWRMVEWTV